jgi:hypothetical protein
MNRTVYTIVLGSLIGGLAACTGHSGSTSEEPVNTNDSVAPAEVVVEKESPPAVASNRVAVPAAATPAPPAPRATVNIPEGTKLRVALLSPLSSDKSRPGDEFDASLIEPIVIDGKTVIAKGAKLRGRVVDAEDSGRVKGLARLELTLTEIVPNGGKAIRLSTRSFTSVAESTKKRDAAVIGGSAGVGAAIGAIAGGKKGAAIGAAVGGGAGTGTVLATKGAEVEFDREHPLTFTLSKPLQM